MKNLLLNYYSLTFLLIAILFDVIFYRITSNNIKLKMFTSSQLFFLIMILFEQDIFVRPIIVCHIVILLFPANLFFKK